MVRRTPAWHDVVLLCLVVGVGVFAAALVRACEGAFGTLALQLLSFVVVVLSAGETEVQLEDVMEAWSVRL